MPPLSPRLSRYLEKPPRKNEQDTGPSVPQHADKVLMHHEHGVAHPRDAPWGQRQWALLLGNSISNHLYGWSGLLLMRKGRRCSIPGSFSFPSIANPSRIERHDQHTNLHELAPNLRTPTHSIIQPGWTLIRR